jgi:hypothetical protein
MTDEAIPPLWAGRRITQGEKGPAQAEKGDISQILANFPFFGFFAIGDAQVGRGNVFFVPLQKKSTPMFFLRELREFRE